MEQIEPEQALNETQAGIEEFDYIGAMGRLDGLDLTEWPDERRAEALAMRAVCAEGLADSDGAEAIVAGMLDGEEGPAFLLAAGLQFAELDAPDRAVEILRKLCEVDAESHAAFYNLALVFERDGQHEEAIEAFETAFDREPEFTASLAGMAHCLEEIGDLPGAAETRAQYLQREPDDADEWVAMGAVQSDLGNFDKAAEAFQAAQRINPISVELYYEWAVSAVAQDDRDRVAASADRLAELAPDHWRTLMIAARLAEIEGRTWQGWETCLRAYELAARTDDEAERSEAAANFLYYAVRNRLGGHTEGFVDRLFKQGPITEDVLAGLRELADRHSDQAAQYIVLIEGDAPGPADAGPKPEEESKYRYFRSYGVLAENEGQARDLVVEFETRCGGRGLRVDAVEPEGDPIEDYLGVAWRSSLAVIYSPQDAEQ